MSLPDPVASERKLKAKKANERLKLAVSFLNTLSLGILGAAFIVPGVVSMDAVRWVWIPVGLVLHFLAHLALGYLKSED